MTAISIHLQDRGQRRDFRGWLKGEILYYWGHFDVSVHLVDSGCQRLMFCRNVSAFLKVVSRDVRD
jgi:hypothetical protein